MKFDITLEMTKELEKKAQENHGRLRPGHFGTHFDVMNKTFPLEYVEREGIFFDVSGVAGRDISVDDIRADEIGREMFVGFYTGFIEKMGYGTAEYFGIHPALSDELIDLLIGKEVSIIGLDFSGARNGAEHNPTDQRCADRGVFIVENLCGLKAVVDAGGKGTVGTYPVRYSDLTGLPCRVVVDI